MPIVMKSTVLPALFTSELIYQLFVGVMFIVQTMYLLFYFLIVIKSQAVDKNIIIFTIIFTIAPILTMVISTLTIKANILDIIYILSRFINLVIFLWIPSRIIISKDSFKEFMGSIANLGLIASIYNLLINYDALLDIINISNPYLINFSSFYFNRNTFAQLLLISVIANTYLYAESKSYVIFFRYFIFAVSIVLALSRTTIIAVLIFIFLLYLVNNKLNIFRVFLSSLFIAGLTVVFRYNKTVYDFIETMIIRRNMGTSGRSFLWKKGIDILNETNWFFGVGHMNSESILSNFGYNLTEFHSFYIEILVGGGIIDFVLHLILLVIVIKRIKIICDEDSEFGNIWMAGITSILFYGFAESISFFTMGYVGTLLTVFFITVPLLYANNLSKSLTIAKK